MKTTSLFLVVFLAFCTVRPSSAQVHVGVLGGLNLATISMEPDPGADFSGRTVFGFGGVLGVGLGENTVLYVEPMYLQKGGVRTAQVDDDEIKTDNEIKLAYLDVPFMLRFALGSGNIQPFVMVGPTIGFKLSAKVEKKAGSNPGEKDMKNDIKSIDLGFGFGAGVSLPIGKSSVFFEARYALGLSDINDVSEANTPDVKTRGFQIFTGFTFPLGGK